MQPDMDARTIERWMSRDVLTLPKNAKLGDALELMERSRIRHVPILDEEGRLCGIVSDRDVKRALPSGPAFDKIGRSPLSRVMTKNVIRMDPGATLREAAELMCREKISALPVCEGDDLVGIVTAEDLLWAYVELESDEEELRDDEEIDRGFRGEEAA